jgi:hypothetical protein
VNLFLGFYHPKIGAKTKEKTIPKSEQTNQKNQEIDYRNRAIHSFRHRLRHRQRTRARIRSRRSRRSSRGGSPSKEDITGVSTEAKRNKLVFFKGAVYTFDLEDLLRALA